MGFVKANDGEPLMKDRKKNRRCQNRGHNHGSGISGGDGLFAADAASGLKVASARIGLTYGTLGPVVPMLREKPKRRSRKGQSTDAGHRGGTARSSVEASVMGVERRGRVIVPWNTGPTPGNRGRSL
jgi:hypothetical protein